MNRKIVAILLISASFALQACQKNSDIFVPDPGQLNGPDTAWYSSITPSMPVSSLKDGLLLPAYTDTVQISTSTNSYVQTPFGLLCGFPPNCCITTAGQTVSGRVQVELMLLKKKGDIIRMNKPTESNGRLLISGGQLFIRLTKNNQELLLAPNTRLQLRYPDSPLNPQMIHFISDESNPQKYNWLPDTDHINNTVAVAPQNYEIQTNRLHWSGIDTFYNTNGTAETTVTATLAPQFTNANTIAFIVFQDFRSVVSLNADIASRKFTSIRLPSGKNATLIIISKQGNDYFMDHRPLLTATTTTLPANQNVQATPVITTLATIKAYLDSL